MGVNSLPKTVTRQRRGCDLNPGPSAPESSTLTTRLPSRAPMCRLGQAKVGILGYVASVKHYLNAIKVKQSALNARKPQVCGQEPQFLLSILQASRL